MIIDGRNHYPQDIEATAAEAAPIVRRGYATAFSVPADNPPGSGTSDADNIVQRLVLIAERATGTSRADPQPAIEAISDAVSQRHGLTVSDVRLLVLSPRTTTGKLARRACRAQYLNGAFGVH